jgi:hypothetical protein
MSILPRVNNLKLKDKGYWQVSLHKGICRIIGIRGNLENQRADILRVLGTILGTVIIKNADICGQPCSKIEALRAPECR